MPSVKHYRAEDGETDDNWLTGEQFPLRTWRWHGWMEDG